MSNYVREEQSVGNCGPQKMKQKCDWRCGCVQDVLRTSTKINHFCETNIYAEKCIKSRIIPLNLKKTGNISVMMRCVLAIFMLMGVV